MIQIHTGCLKGHTDKGYYFLSLGERGWRDTYIFNFIITDVFVMVKIVILKGPVGSFSAEKASRGS